ncbi:MAG: amidohydrolase family protein [Bacteroidales bacterium]|nr:amidohydrolase family protein [Bacteroidales bacterium]
MILLEGATIVTSDKEAEGSILIKDGKIAQVLYSEAEDYGFRVFKAKNAGAETVDCSGLHVMAGGIDAHVHFREPGLTHKADMATESLAAIYGGVTSVMDMPNTNPATVTAEALQGKLDLAKEKAHTKTAFHIGATNDNAEAICKMVREGDAEAGITPEDIAGVKVFMGSSTGNMLVDSSSTLGKLFSIKEKPVLVHCEDEATIKANLEKAIEKYGNDIPFTEHENIRSRMACIKSSIKALELAMQYGTKLVLCHISTKEEAEMVRAAKLNNPEIIAETSCNYLWFSNEDYTRLGSKVKCNPSVKTAQDREALINALAEGIIDTIGSDHAPHLLSEKEGTYTKAPSGLPTIQQSLPVLLTIAHNNEIPLTRIASVFSEKAAEIYGLNRGKIAEGYEADLVIFDNEATFVVKNEDQKSKCGWTPYDGETLRGEIKAVYIDGNKII